MSFSEDISLPAEPGLTPLPAALTEEDTRASCASVVTRIDALLAYELHGVEPLHPRIRDTDV